MSAVDWPAVLSGGLGVAILGAVVAIVRAVMGRPLVQASAADQISTTALKLIVAAERSAERAGQEATDAKREATDARREATDARRAADEAAREVRLLKSAILAPTATLERLREMVGEPGANGSAGVRV
ncbi:hypothetical protein Rhe02_55740 [Rhizocola hellebori]|uniref:Uncharacterized protein n=1 Tax=Rhizocola hellebori TaxID=1392758 RepID=A0A8J3QD91_9ACTN|nr:hypothetical protein [Rhizocola hellebori]GIH07507.1 hypothetical protein Rhe02_55740 [Rhizocola hellebori]